MTGSVIKIERSFSAPVERVFQAWTDPRLLTQWLAGRADVEPRLGGHYRLESDGDEDAPGIHVCSGKYLEFVPGKRISKTWVYNGPNPEDLGESVVTVDFEERPGGGAFMQFREEGETLDTPEERNDALASWSSAFDSLDQVTR